MDGRRRGPALRLHGEVSRGDRLRSDAGVRRDPGIAALAPASQQTRADLGQAGREGMKATTRPKLLRVAGLPAVKALFATAPQRVERLFFDQRFKTQAGDFCAQLARPRASAPLVHS